MKISWEWRENSGNLVFLTKRDERLTKRNGLKTANGDNEAGFSIALQNTPLFLNLYYRI